MTNNPEILYNKEIARRLKEKNPKFYSDKEVRGKLADEEPAFNKNDGWE